MFDLSQRGNSDYFSVCENTTCARMAARTGEGGVVLRVSATRGTRQPDFCFSVWQVVPSLDPELPSIREEPSTYVGVKSWGVALF